MESRLRASHEQFSFLIKFMEKHGDLSRPQPGLQGKIRCDRLWQELTKKLNSIGGCGVNKTADKWKRVWSDWKTKTKKKVFIKTQDMCGTGGGTSKGKPLRQLEERVLRVIGLTSTTRNQAIQEAGLENPTSDSSYEAIEAWDLEPSQPLVRHAVDTAEKVPSPVEIECLRVPVVLEDTPTSVSADLSVPQACPVSPVPHSSNGSTIQGERSPVSAGPSTLRRHFRHRRVRQTPFDRVTSVFVATEESRLRSERERDARLHALETERLKIEAQRVELERERIKVEADRIRVEEVRTGIDADLRNSIQDLSAQIRALITILGTRDLRPN